ncbi:MAG: hypothetical protein ABJZ55_14010 [Fuerstiella sp.]
MLRLIAFSVLLSLCIPTLLVSFFETVGAGSAENDLQFARMFQFGSPDSSQQSTRELTQPSIRPMSARSICLKELGGQDAIEAERMQLLGMSVEEAAGPCVDRMANDEGHPCSLPRKNRASRRNVSPGRM